MADSKAIDVVDLDFGYAKLHGLDPVPVLQGVNLTLARGSRCLLIGANGAGQSLLLRVPTRSCSVTACALSHPEPSERQSAMRAGTASLARLGPSPLSAASTARRALKRSIQGLETHSTLSADRQPLTRPCVPPRAR